MQNHLLASGGGTADRHIRFWNTQTGSALSSIDTGSQVCNLMFSKTCNEIVSTHGYSLNQVSSIYHSMCFDLISRIDYRVEVSYHGEGKLDTQPIWG